MGAKALRCCLGTLLLMLAGCGSDGASTSGLDGSKKLIDLTHDDLEQFCDWAVSKQGGYETCDEELAFMGYPDVSACVHGDWGPSTGSKCQTTVSQAEACIKSLNKCATWEDVRNSSACSGLMGC